MGSPGPAPDVTVEDALRVFTQSQEPSTPLTSTEVADELACTRRTAHRKLEELAERGEIETKKTGARSRVWWRPPTDVTSASTDRQLNEILDRMTGVFTALDTDWRITHLNEASRRAIVAPLEEDLSKDALVGRRLWEINPNTTSADVQETELYRSCHEAMERQEMISYERYYEDEDLWVYTRVYPSETGVSIFSQDISERKAYERELEASNERLEQFAYAVSHDLQEPLRMVSSYLQLLERRYADALDEDGEEFLAFAVDGAERMKTMIDGLLEYSRIETQGDPLESVDLDAVLEDVRDDLQFQIQETGTEIRSESLPAVEGDPNQLRQLFQNLLSNAVTYSGDEPPRVDISADQDGDEWVISISDEGIGIEPEKQEFIFEVFQRLHSHDEYEGTGIGLAICKRIVERHGGDIWVDSEPGEGSTFSVTLSAASDEAS